MTTNNDCTKIMLSEVDSLAVGQTVFTKQTGEFSPPLLTGKALVACLLMALALFTSGCSNIQGAVEGAQDDFDKLDTDDDGVISRSEALDDASINKSFDRLDTNQDSTINPAEYKAGHIMIANLDFRDLDFNSDGVISTREANSSRPSLKRQFKVVDSDRDNNVSASEYRAATTNLMASTEFSSIDRDRDGVIDKKEARRSSALKQSFADVDLDQDGLISKPEYAKAQKR